MLNPGHAAVEVTPKKGGEPCEVLIRCRREPTSGTDVKVCCRVAIKLTAKEHSKRITQYTARFVRFEPDNSNPLPTGRRTFTGYVLQDRPWFGVQVKPFEADSPEEAWVECVRRVKLSYREGQVYEERLYGAAQNVDDKRDRHDVERKIRVWQP